jgi:glycerophosphoryl diester phosphodiesterase
MLMPVARDAIAEPDLQRPLVIAHRGASGLAPENTLSEFQLALALGADGVEMDVQLSADGHPVVIHDARVNRTTNAAGYVSGLTLDQLQNLDAASWFERRLTRRPRLRTMVNRIAAETGDRHQIQAREPVPTLEAVLSLLAGAGVERIYVELKGSATTRQPLLAAVLALVRTLEAERLVTLLSFDHEIVRSAKLISGGIRTAATFPARGRRLISTRSILTAAEHAGVDEVALHFGLASRRAVEAFHERGLSVAVWTVNSKLAMRRLVACGVDSIMTNFPNRLREILVSSAQRPMSALSRRRQRNS